MPMTSFRVPVTSEMRSSCISLRVVSGWENMLFSWPALHALLLALVSIFLSHRHPQVQVQVRVRAGVHPANISAIYPPTHIHTTQTPIPSNKPSSATRIPGSLYSFPSPPPPAPQNNTRTAQPPTHHKMEDFQSKCFGKPLNKVDLDHIKQTISRISPNAISTSGISPRGFLLLNKLYAEKGRHETVWAVLRTFQYTDSLSLEGGQRGC
ncbi:hypothetical protein EPUS_04246 [Endocarpon pusillum Z07020]|uniref:EF hand associated type-2 domain-containing protein n=1 Tax=Endocarpon pusillum (strain Z07020 / HMAS-L-300199) TaxID=1263415 RepID=U1GLN4_ENDPU|nr:uncharacterized protein EPUS_04246 [Endocarpon pusillum Z07020]ERF72811.1 hypothetical protein EPUS_04246 [Endocarpon pusillum Z07020]